MAHFRCYFLDSTEHIVSAEDIDADTAAQAIDLSAAAFANRTHHAGFEVWERTIRLHKARRDHGAKKPGTAGN